MPVKIDIVGDYTDREVNRAIKDLQLLGTHGQASGAKLRTFGEEASAAFHKSSVAGVAMGAGIGVAAFQAIQVGAQMALQFGVDSVNAFIADDAAAQSLAQTFEQLGLATQSTGVETFIAQTETAAAVADDQLRPALDRLVRSTHDVQQAQDLLGLALDISAKRHVSLEAASNAVGKAVDGNYGALAKLAGGYTTAELKAMGLTSVVSTLSNQFAGSASAAAGTYQGQLALLGIQFGNIQESFGKGFLDGVTASMGGAKGAGEQLTPVMESLAANAESLGRSIGSVASNITPAIAGIKVMWGAFSVLDAGLGSVIAKMIALTFAMRGDFAAASAIVAEADRKLLVASGALATATQDLTQGTVDGIPVTLSAASALDEQAAAANRAAVALSGKVRAEFAAMSKLDNLSQDAAGRKAFANQQLQLQINLDNLAADAKNNYGGAAGSAAAKVDKLSAAQQKMAADIQAATGQTKSAIDAFNAYGTAAADVFTSKLSLGTASEGVFKLQDERAAKVKATLADLVAYQATLSSEQTQAEKDKVAELQAVYQQASAEAAAGGQSVVDAFVEQASKVRRFAETMQTLLKAGLSESAYKEIAGMQVEAGARLADALINGNMAENIARTNDAIGSVQTVASTTGQMAAQSFATAGLQLAQGLVQGLLTALGPAGRGRASLLQMMDNLASAMTRTATITVVGVYSGAGNGPAGSSMTSDAGSAPSDSVIDAGFGGVPIGGIPGLLDGIGVGLFAAGGSVMGGVPIIVGEKGPELFVPGSNGSIVPNSGGSPAGGNSYQITVQAGVGDPRAIGQQIIEYVKKFEQANGPVFAAA
jgi:hypothetical protein